MFGFIEIFFIMIKYGVGYYLLFGWDGDFGGLCGKNICYFQFVYSFFVLMVDISFIRNVNLKDVGEIIVYQYEGRFNKINIDVLCICNNENICSYLKRNSLIRGLGCIFNDL